MDVLSFTIVVFLGLLFLKIEESFKGKPAGYVCLGLGLLFIGVAVFQTISSFINML